MKKVILTLLALSLSATVSYAAYQAVDTGSVVIPASGTKTMPIKGSKGVQIDYVADTANGQGYVLGSYHASGTQTYGSSSGDTKIYKQDGTNVAIPTTAPIGSDTANFASPWAAM